MKTNIKNFLFKKRFKILKNKKGFTLMEVLVAVGLIGIITAIAVPQFQDYREQTGMVAGDASTSNIARAYQACTALNDFASCNTLSEIGIKCEGCTDMANANNRTSPPFCANYAAKAGTKEFKMCVSVTSTDSVSKTIGGAFQVCHESCVVSATQTCGGGAYTNKVKSPIKRCKTNATCGTAGNGISFSCPATPNTRGLCDANGACV